MLNTCQYNIFSNYIAYVFYEIIFSFCIYLIRYNQIGILLVHNMSSFNNNLPYNNNELKILINKQHKNIRRLR